MRLLIIEDELTAAKRLQRMLHSYDEGIEVLEVIDSVTEAVRFFKEKRSIDLVLMDVQLSDGMCFEIFKQVQVIVPIIFTTAYDEYALQAFKVNSIDYLLKPIHQNDLDNSLKKYERLNPQENIPDYRSLDTDLAPRQNGYKSRFLVKMGSCMQSIESDEIAYFYSEDKLTYLVTKENKKFIVEFSLEELIKQLDPVRFFKISRQFIISHKMINQIHPYFNNRLKLDLMPDCEKEVLVSRSNVREFSPHYS